MPIVPALIDSMYARDDARWLAELLMDMRDEVGRSLGCGSWTPWRREVGGATT